MGILQARILEWVAMPSTRGREGWELIRGLTENVGTVWIREVRRKGVKDETQDAGR